MSEKKTQSSQVLDADRSRDKTLLASQMWYFSYLFLMDASFLHHDLALSAVNTS